jgi:YVTN family beta-propeller protein
MLTVLAAPPAGQASCTGDCDVSNNVVISELVTAVNIALGSQPLSRCESIDADHNTRADIYELIGAVGNSLNGCTAGTPKKASKSGPIAISPDGSLVVAVNTDVNTISIFEVNTDGTLTKVKELATGEEPRSVALLSNKPWAYVANTLSGNVRVVNLLDYSTVATIPVGTEPQAVVASANGLYVYVANANDNTVSAIDTTTNVVFATIPVGRSPRALAITNDGDNDDLDEKIYVTNFFGRPRAGFTPPSTDNLGGTMAGGDFPTGAKGKAVIGEGIFDDSREGVVDVIDATSNAVVGHIVLGPLANTGFNIARGPFVNTTPDDVPRTIFADGATDGTQPQPTGAYPNMLQSIVLFGNRGFVPNAAASPEPPLRLNGNVQSLLSVFDTGSGQEIADQTFNLNKGINFDLPAALLDAQVRDNTERLFPSVPVDIDCSEATNACWVVSQGSDFIVRMTFDANGKPTINAPTAAGPFAVSPVTRIFTIDPANATSSGRNPRGIAISEDGLHGYVVCPTTRDVIVADLGANSVIQRVRSADLPTQAADLSILRGKIDFFTSRPFWSDRGWGGCASCHPDGRTDNVTWSFEAGPRQTIALDGTFNKLDDSDHRALNWSPVRDENRTSAQHPRRVRRPRLHYRRYGSQRGWHPAGFRPERTQLRAGQLEPLDAAGVTSPTTSRPSAARSHRRPAAERDPRSRHFRQRCAGWRQLRRLSQR